VEQAAAMKGSSEDRFREALNGIDVRKVVYKPPDDARTWKPCDFMVWSPQSTWFEVKDVDTVNTFAFSQLRLAQVRGIGDADRIGIPYWLAVYWRRHRSWTISNATTLLWWRRNQTKPPASVSREALMSRFGVDATPANLGSTLKSILLGEV
jgi:hypothetical protein